MAWPGLALGMPNGRVSMNSPQPGILCESHPSSPLSHSGYVLAPPGMQTPSNWLDESLLHNLSFVNDGQEQLMAAIAFPSYRTEEDTLTPNHSKQSFSTTMRRSRKASTHRSKKSSFLCPCHAFPYNSLSTLLYPGLLFSSSHDCVLSITIHYLGI